MNRMYHRHLALHELELTGCGFEWIVCHDSPQSVHSYLRKDSRGNMVASPQFYLHPAG